MSGERILILGGTGMLGHKLVQRLSERFDTFCTIRQEFSSVESLDLFDRSRVIDSVSVEDFDAVKSVLNDLRPSVVINGIGIIKQLPTSHDVIQTLSINSIFPHLIANLSGELGFRFINVSTDCVFSGSRGNYRETDTPDALDLYGRSKQYGEVDGLNCLTIRTSIIGREIGTAHSLVDWFLSQSGRVRGYSKAIFSGFPTIVFADILADVITHHTTLSGIHHVSSDPISKFDLLSLIKKRIPTNNQLEPDEGVVIDRSLNSDKFREITGFTPLPWGEMVDRMFSDPTPYGRFQ